MATLDSLKRALEKTAEETGLLHKKALSDSQYLSGFDMLMQGSGWVTYRDFIIPQLSELLAPLFTSRGHISALEIGPGPKSVLGYLPDHLRQKVGKYVAFEPNQLFANSLEEWFHSASQTESVLGLDKPIDIRRVPFVLGDSTDTDTNYHDKFDLILFCHSMYGMKPKRSYIEQALGMLQKSGMVVIVQRDVDLHLEGLSLDCFASFIAETSLHEGGDVNEAIRFKWRKVCRTLGCREESHPGCLFFSSPEIMLSFTKDSMTMLSELTGQVPVGNTLVKNWEARHHGTASVFRPRDVQQVQQCVRWALKHKVGITVLGGGHSGHCLRPNTVAVDMGAFDEVQILSAKEQGAQKTGCGTLIVAGAGCKTGDIIRETLKKGLAVPLGSRPSVGAGLWLQGGIGHLARLHGLACDAIVGIVMVDIRSGQLLCIGQVPSQHQPGCAVRSEFEADLSWAMKGAGTNFGVVVSVIFKTYPAPTYMVESWVTPLADDVEAQCKLGEFDEFIARKLPSRSSADAYLYWDSNRLHLGVTRLEACTTQADIDRCTKIIEKSQNHCKFVDGVGLFDTEMYMSGMHSGHGGGKTSSFKRCMFLRNIGAAHTAQILVAAIASRPSPLCYLHLLHGGGATADVTANATAFGCRDWDFACVITGVWPRNQDGTAVVQAAINWVYKVANDLLPVSIGAYGADLGPDPRDAVLAAAAFGPNRLRLARLKHALDPYNVLPHACPLPKVQSNPKLIVLFTGESCAGKDHCASVCVTALAEKGIIAQAASISDAIKREYAAAVDADIDLLIHDRAYKEQHRLALTAYFQDQVQKRPQLPEEQFLSLVHAANDVDVLVITGMRDEAPVATLSHLVPNSRLLEVYVRASQETRWARGASRDKADHYKTALDHRPNFILDNNNGGSETASKFAKTKLLPFFQEEWQQLADMVRQVPGFPHPDVEFRHVLNIAQQPGGLNLCTSLLKTYFEGDWVNVDFVACCEAGGLVFASALATRVNLPVALIREAGKLPPPTLSTTKSPSHMASCTSNDVGNEKRIEMGLDVVHRGASVVVVDDVLATGNTLCAVLRLLEQAGVDPADIGIMVIAEFPHHHGRELLRQAGFGKVNIQSLLVLGGA